MRVRVGGLRGGGGDWRLKAGPPPPPPQVRNLVLGLLTGGLGLMVLGLPAGG